MISELKNSIDLVSVVETAGVELSHHGNKHLGLCPLHAEKTPSFYVFQDNRFKCFGCGERGDVIDFVQKLYGLSFVDALKHLGIAGKPVPKKVYLKRNKDRMFLQQKQEEQLNREVQITEYLVTMIRATEKAAKNIKTMDDLEKYGNILMPVETWKYQLGLLTYGAEADRVAVCKEYENIKFEPVERLWNASFNYSNWFNETIKRKADEWEINLQFKGCKEGC